MGKQQQSNQTSKTKSTAPHFFNKRIAEGGFIFIISIALFVLLALSTYDLRDPNWTHPSLNKAAIANAGGQVGAYVADSLYYCFGYFSFFLPFTVAYVAWFVLKEQKTFASLNKHALFLRSTGLVLLIISGCGLLDFEFQKNAVDSYRSAGGLIGHFVAAGFEYALSLKGAILFLLTLFLMGVTLLTGLSWIHFTETLGFYTLFLANHSFHFLKTTYFYIRQKLDVIKANKEEQKEFSATKRPSLAAINEAPTPTKPSKKEQAPKPVLSPSLLVESEIIPPSIKIIEPEPLVEKPKKEAKTKVDTSASGDLPSLQLLDEGQPGKALGGYTHQELETLSRQVEQHLLDFGIQAEVVAVHPGPVITRFELQLAAGIKVSKLSALSKDLARSLSVTSVRVVEVIPGKTVVGIELPNQIRDMVRLKEVLAADVYQQANSPLTLALGVDIAGHPMVVDLAKMPHLLVAGTTGSGKSVGINAMILSLLFKSTPEDVRLIMVDPKMLELSVYDGIPHLLTPVVTDMKEAASALRWCVGEMERRYRLMAALGVRNIAGFNTKVKEAKASGEELRDPLWKPIDSIDTEPPVLETLPYVVVFIDELADMMMVVGKKVEQLIARIAQKARAAGIHLILATQRPSVDVLTGLIKSNIPTRISFQVSSKIDSRTILDQQGAEQLLGHGDMLYQAPGTGAPLRVHGAYVDDQEVHRIADDWRSRGEPEYIDEITQLIGDGEGGFGDEGGASSQQQTEDSDALYDQAVEFVIQTRKASISAVQRRFKIGYNRAARLVEEMERTGIVGPLEGGFREVLVSTLVED